MADDARAVLVIGAARSGKSRYAQALAAASRRTPVFIATAQAFDEEMSARIAAHRADRPPHWHTVEAPLDLAGTIAEWAHPDRVLLVDCLTLWLSNITLAGQDVEAACATLVHAIRAAKGPLILVSNEVGAGIVPENALARRFRDAQGRLNQQIATCCSHLVLIAAGFPLLLKPAAAPSIRL